MTDIFKETVTELPISIDKETGKIKVGEKVFANVEELAKSKYHADTMIDTLKAEKSTVTNELKEVKAKNELFSKVEEKLNQQKTTQDLSNLDDSSVVTTKTQELQTMTVDNAQIEKVANDVVTKTLADVTAKQTYETNKEKINTKLIDLCGSESEAQKAVQKFKASGAFDQAVLDMQIARTPDQVVELVMKHAEVKPTSTNYSIAPRSVTNQSSKPVQLTRTIKSEMKVMKDNPKVYYSPAYQQSLIQYINSLGPKGSPARNAFYNQD